MPLRTDFVLDAAQTGALRQAVVDVCDKDDILRAYERYPGELPPGDFPDWERSVRELIEAYHDVIRLENADFSSSFLLRVIEQKWLADDPAKSLKLWRGVAEGAPAIVRPSVDVGAHVDTIIGALNAMLAGVPESVGPGAIGDVVAFGRLCSRRDGIEQLVQVLRAFDALKGLQDNLMMLKVQGAPWLRPGGSDPMPAVEALAALCDRVAQTAARVATDLPGEVTDIAAQSRLIAETVSTQLRVASPAKLPSLFDAINAMLATSTRALRDALFTVSRDLPLKGFRGIFAGQDEVVLAVIDLCDTMRRRLMQHVLWQITDDHLASLDDIVFDRAAWRSGEVTRFHDAVRFNLIALTRQRLTRDAQGPARMFAAFADAMASGRLEFGTPTTDAGRKAQADITTALAALRAEVRSAMLNIDQTLRTEIGHVLRLNPVLNGVLDRIPFNCAMMVPQ